MQSIVLVSSSPRSVDFAAEHCSSLCTVCLGVHQKERSTHVSISDLESGCSHGTKTIWPTPIIPAQKGRHGQHKVRDAIMPEQRKRTRGEHRAAQYDPSLFSACTRYSYSRERDASAASPVQLKEKLM